MNINNMGWKCPFCGRVNAPYIDCCPCSLPAVPYPQPYPQPYTPWPVYPTPYDPHRWTSDPCPFEYHTTCGGGENR